MGWTQFTDRKSGGRRKLQWAHIYIDAPIEDACHLFAEAFGRDPEHVTCDCCGSDYAIHEFDDLAQATGFERGLRWATPPAGEGRWFEPGEPIPDGWEPYPLSSPYEERTFDAFLADPYVVEFEQRLEVLVMSARGVLSSA